MEVQEDEDGLEYYGLQMIMNPDDQKQNGIIGEKQSNENVEGREQKLSCVTELKADSKLFAMQQKEGESLAQWWKLSEGKRSEFVVINEFLYKIQKNFDEKVYQLVLPKCRRAKVLQIAHDSIFGGHLAFVKIYERVKLSFTWPRMRNNIYWYCKTCEHCQLNSKVLSTNSTYHPESTRTDPVSKNQYRLCGPFRSSISSWA